MCRSDKNKEPVSDPEERTIAEEESEMLRQQAENLVQVSHQSIRNMVAESGGDLSVENEQDLDGQENENEDPSSTDIDGLTSETGALQLWQSQDNRDAAQWLYNAVFSAAGERNRKEHHDLEDEPRSDHSMDETPVERPDKDTLALQPAGNDDLQVLVGEMPDTASIVNRLLSQWTTLSWPSVCQRTSNRIEEHNNDWHSAKDDSNEHGKDSPKYDGDFVLLFDITGRTNYIPWYQARRWEVSEAPHHLYPTTRFVSDIVLALLNRL